MSEKLRWKIAPILNRLRRFCWVDLVDWAMGTYRGDGEELQGPPARSQQCRVEGSKPGCSCYCGKFKAPAES